MPEHPKPASPARDHSSSGCSTTRSRRAGGAAGPPRSGGPAAPRAGRRRPDWYSVQRHRPNRGVEYWDITTRRRHVPATDRPDGTTHATALRRRPPLWWFDDTDGDEFGSWRAQPFGVGPGQRAAALPDVPPGYPAGLRGRHVRGRVAGFSDDDGTRIHLRRTGGEPEVVYRHAEDGGVGALSTDETVWVLSHSEHGDSRYPALRAIVRAADDRSSRETVRRAGQGPCTPLRSRPVARRPAAAGRARAPRPRRAADLGPRRPARSPNWTSTCPATWTRDFYPDGPALLVVHTHAGRTTRAPLRPGLRRADRRCRRPPAWCPARGRATGRRALVPLVQRGLAGAVPGAGPRRHRRRAAAPPGSRRRVGTGPRRRGWTGPGGPIHALLARLPAGPTSGRVPTVFPVHGGPAAADEDSFDAEPGGLAGRRIRGRAGQLPRLDRLRLGRGGTRSPSGSGTPNSPTSPRCTTISSPPGVVDPAASVIAGYSWGGFLTLLASAPSRSAGRPGSPACRSPTTWRRTRTRWSRCGPTTGRCSAGHRQEVPRRLPRLVAADLRRPGARAGAGAGRRERPALPDPADRQLPRRAGRARRAVRGLPLRRRPRVDGGGRAAASAGLRDRFRPRRLLGSRRAVDVGACPRYRTQVYAACVATAAGTPGSAQFREVLDAVLDPPAVAVAVRARATAPPGRAVPPGGSCRRSSWAASANSSRRIRWYGRQMVAGVLEDQPRRRPCSGGSPSASTT